jgi:hypothetical protein
MRRVKISIAAAVIGVALLGAKPAAAATSSWATWVGWSSGNGVFAAAWTEQYEGYGYAQWTDISDIFLSAPYSNTYLQVNQTCGTGPGQGPYQHRYGSMVATYSYAQCDYPAYPNGPGIYDTIAEIQVRVQSSHTDFIYNNYQYP